MLVILIQNLNSDPVAQAGKEFKVCICVAGERQE